MKLCLNCISVTDAATLVPTDIPPNDTFPIDKLPNYAISFGHNSNFNAFNVHIKILENPSNKIRYYLALLIATPSKAKAALTVRAMSFVKNVPFGNVSVRKKVASPTAETAAT